MTRTSELIEEWRPVVGYETQYEVSNFGEIRRIPYVVKQKNKWGGYSVFTREAMPLKKCLLPNGYYAIGLWDGVKQNTTPIHRIVAMAFLEKPEGKDCINHLDANPKNNRVDNIVWCTQSENIQYAYDNGTKIPPHMRKVIQMDDEGNAIAEFFSLAEAERVTGAYEGNIYKCCTGKREHAGGYRWKYAE